MSDLENLRDELLELEDKKEEIEFKLQENIDDNDFYEDQDDFKDWKKRARYALMKTNQRIRRLRVQIRDTEKTIGREEAREEQEKNRVQAEEKRKHQAEQREAHKRMAELKAESLVRAAKEESVRRGVYNDHFVSLAKERLERDVYLSIAREAQHITEL